MYKLRLERKDKVTITSSGHKVDNDFFVRYKNANEIISTNKDVAKYFTTLEGNAIATLEHESSKDEGFVFDAEIHRSKNFKVAQALEILGNLTAEESLIFLEGETRKSLVINEESINPEDVV